MVPERNLNGPVQLGAGRHPLERLIDKAADLSRVHEGVLR